MSGFVKGFTSPGKAFIAGGYLVLDQKYLAYTVGLSARMHAVIEGIAGDEGMIKIAACSPQFDQGVWNYECKEGTCEVESDRKNPFIEAAVRVVMAYLMPKASSVKITIYSDNEYHSQEDPSDTKSSLGKFTQHSKAISGIPKTGLGSSASLTVVVVAALLSYFGNSQNFDRNVYVLSQLAHCMAQGKIGSGFDIASAVFGTVIYRRFDPELIAPLTDAGNITHDTVVNLVDNNVWKDIMPKQCKMPRKYALLMGDVQVGSETPKLVSKVLQWRKECPDRALEVWTNLDAANMAFVKSLENEADDIGERITEIRKWMKIMTSESGAPIEPDSQTEILDAVSKVPGVMGAVVPGAGGYDAVALIVEAEKIEQIKQDAANVDVLKSIQWLGLREDNEGLVDVTEKLVKADVSSNWGAAYKDL